MTIGSICFFLKSKNNNSKEKLNLSIEYIGGDKFIGQDVEPSDFKVIYLPTKTLLNPEEYTLDNTSLSLDGTSVAVMYTAPDGKFIKEIIVVYPTLAINSIRAELIRDRYLGNTLSNKDFKVIAVDNKGNEYKINNYSISKTIIEEPETDITISYTNSGNTYTSDVHISATENFISSLKATYVGKNNYIGQSVKPEDFNVIAVYADETEKELKSFGLVNSELTGEKTAITVAVENEKKEVVKTDVEVEGKAYISEIKSIRYVGQAQTVGNTVTTSDFEVIGLKSDGSTVKIEDFKITEGNILLSNSNEVVISTVNELGALLTLSTTVNASENIIFVGDSRVAGMKKYINSLEDSSINTNCYYIYTDKADYKWLSKEAIKKVQSIMDKNAYTTFRVVFNVGLYDFNNEQRYADLYKSLAKEKWAKHKIFVASLNPVNEEQMDKAKKYSRKNINTTEIKNFNTAMDLNLKDVASNLIYINTNGSLINHGFVTTDGVNYDDDTYGYYNELIKDLTH